MKTLNEAVTITPFEPPPDPPNGDNGEERGQEAPKGQGAAIILPPPTKPMNVARVVEKTISTDDGLLKLRHWRGSWWSWQTSHWTEAEDDYVKSLLYRFTENALYCNDEGKFKAWAPTRRKIGDLIEALAAICILRSDIDQPCWLDGRTSGVIVSLANGLLDIRGRRLLPHTPQFFNQTAVPFAYDATAPRPKHWLKFLGELWPLDPGQKSHPAADLLQEWFGYVISGLLHLHKIFLNVGPTRGGKGLIARILTALVGTQNVAGPTLNSLGGDFGLAPLIGKSLAIISDARFIGKNGNVVVERLLSISGENSLTVNRKYRVQWTGKLPSRLHIISNELPKLGDASEAIIGRIVLVLTTHSWLGKEDHELEQTLLGELPGILNWALDGIERLIKQGNRFTRLASADEAIATMRDLASPVAAFIREKCELTPDGKVGVDALYGAYKQWCEENGDAKASKPVSGRDLKAAFPSLKKQRPWGQDRGHVYVGVALKGHVCAQCKRPPDGKEELCAIGDETVWLHPECQSFYSKNQATPMSDADDTA